MEIATRRILGNLVWIGLILAGRVMGQEPYAGREVMVTPRGEPTLAPTGPGESIGPGTPPAARSGPNPGPADSPPALRPPAVPGEKGRFVGEDQSWADGVFGNEVSPAAGCETCNVGCGPSPWSVVLGMDLMSRSRAKGPELGAVSLSELAQIGSTSLSVASPPQTGGQSVSQNLFAWENDITNIPALSANQAGFDVSPALDLKLRRYLGRDSNQRDHFLEIGYLGLARWSAAVSVTGDPTPHFHLADVNSGTNSTTNPFQLPPQPVIDSFQGDLRSPFPLTEPLYVSVTGNGSIMVRNPLQAETANSILSEAFNRADFMSTSYTSTLNNWEMNLWLYSNNHPDQLVLNPNGEWYRQCESGFYFSYMFGLRAMVIQERFEFDTHSAYYQYNNVSVIDPNQLPYRTQSPGYGLLVTDPNGNPLPATYAGAPGLPIINTGRYVVYTDNNLIGLQVGGDLEYRFCKWTFNLHGKACGAMNVSQQTTRMTGNRSGTPAYYDDFAVYQTRSATIGEFGVRTEYKVRPNLTGRVSYDLMWIGDLALASEQMVFHADPPHNINGAGSAFYNGVTFGLDYTW